MAPRHLFVDFRTPQPKKHRYRHQDHISSMFLAKDTKNNENSALGPFKFCSARGRGTCEPYDKCTQMCRRYVGSAIWRRSVKKNLGKTYRGKTTGGVAIPPSHLRVKGICNCFTFFIFQRHTPCILTETIYDIENIAITLVHVSPFLHFNQVSRSYIIDLVN